MTKTCIFFISLNLLIVLSLQLMLEMLFAVELSDSSSAFSHFISTCVPNIPVYLTYISDQIMFILQSCSVNVRRCHHCAVVCFRLGGDVLDSRFFTVAWGASNVLCLLPVS